ncbi:helix-turn-helix transcriptional regulator [Actinoplanes sp. NPDC051851]|uniref:helix-turn-helix domain-containing protein n=1 Tax=Actinoplanes sp. NPDC051851 TaxID=3154753 RepID=UPI003448C292
MRSHAEKDGDRIGSTVPRRQLARFLRTERETMRDRGDGRPPRKVTIEEAAEALDCSTQKIWRIEGGVGKVGFLDVKALCELYGTEPEYTQVLINLAKATGEKGWWHSYGDTVPDWFNLYVGLESAASRLRKFEPCMMPGLLQAPAYMEAVLRTWGPDLSEEELEKQLTFRRERQRVLCRHFPGPPDLEVIIGESALRAEVNDPGGMHQQLVHLIKANEQHHISVRVLPAAVRPFRAAVGGGFTILEFPHTARGDKLKGEPPTAYVEGVTGALYLVRPHEIAAYEEAWAELAALALSEKDSNTVVTDILFAGGGSHRE